jgi:NADH-quinone oxidoreductase subunit E
MLPETLKTELQQRVATAVTNREAAVDVMKEIQGYYGWLTDEGVREAAEILGLSPLQVEELASFYELIYRRPVGRKVVHVCDSVSCWSVGSYTLLDRIGDALGVREGETTADGTFTLLPCNCLGMCGDGPAVMIGTALYGNLTPEKALAILEKERNDDRDQAHL